MAEASKSEHTNRLVEATSPYLLQHAHNPVDWYPWGEEALARAREEDKPILLSIGYSACHWCHVMAHESFEDEAVAALMNQHFVCVKVDREERPDLDDIYMAATLAMNQGQGGWPMTVFLTPEQEPFFAGTYFPPTDRWGRPGFTTLLGRVAQLWERERAKLREQGARVVEYLRQNAGSAPGLAVGEKELRTAAAQLFQAFDDRWGGFGNAPKFPPSTALSLLLRVQRRFGDAHALPMVRKTLDAMARGGMYDQVGGGFCRYSVDERWLVPHFEKMLYDNALLAKAYLEGHQATGEAFYARIAREILDYILREMTAPEGGFYSATDADSEGEEGKFFVWTPQQIAELLGEEDAGAFCAYYDISDAGNWEGKSIPNTPESLESVAARLGQPADVLARSLETARSRVYEARRERVPPGLDDKILTAWNGLMIGALAEGFRVLGDERYLTASRRAADFLLATLRLSDGKLLRTYRAGKAHLDAYLEDYAYLAEALIDLYEAGGEERYLREAEKLAGQIHEGFSSPEGGFYSTAEGHERLVVRHREGHDGAMPNANAAAAHALARLSYLLGRDELRAQAVAAIRAYGKAIANQPRAFAKALLAVDLLLEGPVELALIGAPGSAGLVALQAELAKHHLPNRIVAQHDPARGDASLPLLADKQLVDGKPALYVCRDFACRKPVTDPSEVGTALAQGAAPAERARSTLGAALKGEATAAGTARYAERVGAKGRGAGYGPLGETGLTCSRIGFGGYRVDDDTPQHREALARALLGGCNLVDTSTTYTDGGSERLIGDVLSELVGGGLLRRDEVIVVSKLGYVQGQNLELAMDREREGRPFPDMVKHDEGLWHCIHPEYLADQLARSRDRLQLATLDVCLLHNPEYYLGAGHDELEARRSGFYARLREAFGFLEEQARAGRITCYGVSSNTCAADPDEPGATSLTRMLAAAREAGGARHHFRVLQLPMNLRERSAALRPVAGPRQAQAVIAHAGANGVGVLLNRPLNAIGDDGGLMRIADFPSTEAHVELEAQLAKVSALEAEFNRRIAPHVQTGAGRLRADRLFPWAAELGGLAPQVRGVPHWEHIESSLLMPRLMPILSTLDQTLAGLVAERWHDWRGRYLPELNALMAELRRRATERSRDEVAPLTAALDADLPRERQAESLSRKALWVLTSVPGVSSVLVGMRRPAYVDDALGVLAWPAFPRALKLLSKLPAAGPRDDG